MSPTLIWIIAIAAMTLLILVVRWIGNKVVDKTTDKLHNNSVRKQKAERPNTPERLADRLEQGRKL